MWEKVELFEVFHGKLLFAFYGLLVGIGVGVAVADWKLDLARRYAQEADLTLWEAGAELDRAELLNMESKVVVERALDTCLGRVGL